MSCLEDMVVEFGKGQVLEELVCHAKGLGNELEEMERPGSILSKTMAWTDLRGKTGMGEAWRLMRLGGLR